MNFREIADAVLRSSTARQTEVVAIRHDESLTRFANNCIHQNVTENNVQIVVRAAIGTRVGIAAGNDARPEMLERLAVRACELAKLQPENPEFRGFPGPKPISAISGADLRTAECPPEVRAGQVRVICRKAASAGYVAAGSMTTAAIKLGVANSLGVFAAAEMTAADLSTVIMGDNSSGWAQSSGASVDAINADALADEAMTKVRLGRNASDYAPGEYAVVLDPYAVADIVEMLGYDAGALAVQEERSWMNGRLGRQIMADIITIADNAFDPDGISMPFDFEGIPKRVVPLVERGVAMGPVYDSFTAGRVDGVDTTGHATPPSPDDRFGPLPMNLIMRHGRSSVEDLIRSTKHGLYITRFWYTRPVHPRDAVVTGMTRDGTFVIRDGEIAHAVKSLRFTQSYVDALKNAEALGAQLRTLRSGLGACRVPAAKIGAFRFTGATR